MTSPGVTIDVSHLSKRFGGFNAVNDLSFTVQPGRVTGFLGPNGAGKTTTLRALLGLVTPSSGSATFDGTAYRDLRAPLATVGAALEASSFHPGRSARHHPVRRREGGEGEQLPVHDGCEHRRRNLRPAGDEIGEQPQPRGDALPGAWPAQLRVVPIRRDEIGCRHDVQAGQGLQR